MNVKRVLTISALQSRIFFNFLSKKYFCLKKYEIFHLYIYISYFEKKSKWVGNRDYRVTKLLVQNLDPAVRACVFVCVCVCVYVCGISNRRCSRMHYSVTSKLNKNLIQCLNRAILCYKLIHIERYGCVCTIRKH